ncbi:hypothetical protein AV540_06185 [Brevibacillus parabrevis]|nr:hypothetical protein AV540_06185 [Brevibacillus parabrevis]
MCHLSPGLIQSQSLKAYATLRAFVQKQGWTLAATSFFRCAFALSLANDLLLSLTSRPFPSYVKKEAGLF